MNRTKYPVSELARFDSIENMFREWQAECAKSKNGIVRENADGLVRDGFYPYYTKQPKRILFIGREAYDLEGCDYIEKFLHVYRHGKRVGRSKHLNQHFFHARMLHIAWGLLNGMPDWEEIPWADEIGDSFGTENGISFSFMNLSKISNESGGTKSNFRVIDAFCDESTKSRNFIAEEIALLEPQIIITMNLEDRLDFIGNCEPIEQNPNVTPYRFDTNGHRALLLDCWHFSATTKKNVRDYYEPICEAVKKYS